MHGVLADACLLREDRWDLEAILPGEESRQDLAMDPAAEVIAVVLDPDGRPVTGRVGVVFRRPDSKAITPWYHSGLATEAGELRYREFPPCEYDVRAVVGELSGTTRHRFVLGRENRLEIRLQRR